MMLEKPYFHHPDYSPRVIARKGSNILLDLLLWYSNIRGVSAGGDLIRSCFPSKTAYHSACWRLRKKGIIACNSDDARWPVISVESDWTHKKSYLRDPNKYWRKKWNGIWSVLVYDVPEKERRFRDALRQVLAVHRMGCLQKSVWVSPWDMRPEYDDLKTSVHVDFVSYLFEARTVLGRSNMDIVTSAWDFERLKDVQNWYMRTCQMYIDQLLKGMVEHESVFDIVRSEINAYQVALQNDPLLPRDLHPAGYEGCELFKWHCEFVKHFSEYIYSCSK